MTTRHQNTDPFYQLTLLAPGNLLQSGSSPYCSVHTLSFLPRPCLRTLFVPPGTPYCMCLCPGSFFPPGHLTSQITFSEIFPAILLSPCPELRLHYLFQNTASGLWSYITPCVVHVSFSYGSFLVSMVNP